LNIVSGENVSIEDVSVYSSGRIGPVFRKDDRRGCRSRPGDSKRGTTRLISTNADGIHTSFALGANILATVRRTCDDALAISDAWLAAVSQASRTTVTVSRNFGSPFPPGASVCFIDPATATVVGKASIVSKTPPYAQQTLRDGETVTLRVRSFPQPLAELLSSLPTVQASRRRPQFNTFHRSR
jgi:hypothetical protein